MIELEGKVAVVTGGAGGIGFAVAERFASGGVKVGLADIEEDSLNSAASALRASGANAIGVQTDVSDPESVHNLALRTIDGFAGVHILCNNAGGRQRRVVLRHSPANPAVGDGCPLLRRPPRLPGVPPSPPAITRGAHCQHLHGGCIRDRRTNNEPLRCIHVCGPGDE